MNKKPKAKHVFHKKLKAKIVEKYGASADFAPEVGVHESFVSKIIRGRRMLSPESQRFWANALGCKPSEIFEDYIESSKKPVPKTLLTEEKINGNK